MKRQRVDPVEKVFAENKDNVAEISFCNLVIWLTMDDIKEMI
jgi:hypothetical protein